MKQNFPETLRIEEILDYIPRDNRTVNVVGSHKRNAYYDIGFVEKDEDRFILDITRNGLYDILPESLFHPIDRFDNIPVNEYKERFKAEFEQQELETEKARKYFSIFDQLFLELHTTVSSLRNHYSDRKILTDMIADGMEKEYKENRFVGRTLEFLPFCRYIRGDKTLLTFMLRYILSSEDLLMETKSLKVKFKDEMPRYNTQLDERTLPDDDVYLGNEFEEEIVELTVRYWNEEECDDSFSEFISEMEVFERFVNDYFIGMENVLRFNILANEEIIVLSDPNTFNYLNYNTNLSL